MNPVIIGSRALAYWNPDFKVQDSTDWDVISPEPIDGAEFHDINFLNNREFAKYAVPSDIMLNDIRLDVMPMDYLCAIKRSHLHRDLSFQKHITHYHKYMNMSPDWWSTHTYGLYREREKLTQKEFPQGNPNLMQSKEDFFDDAVTKIHDHDYLHELVAYYDEPLYTRLLRNKDLAWCELDKFNALSYEDRVKCIAEEASVIAIERFLVRTNWKMSSKQAYFRAVDKVCTTLCSGWFRDFAIDNYPAVISLYNSNKFNQIQGALNGTEN